MRIPPESRSVLGANEGNHRFSFDGNDCLYRDHEGFRVVADFEGSGFARVVSEVPLVRVPEPRREFASDFRDGLILRTKEQGRIDVVVSTGREAPVGGPIVSVQGPFSFRGWIVSGDAAATDGNRRRSLNPSPEFPIPVYRTIDSEGWFGVIDARPDDWQLVSEWTIVEALAGKGTRFQIQNLSRIEDLSSEFEDGTPCTLPVASHLNALRWKCVVPAFADSLRLRKTFDRFHGRQRARVLIDGEPAGIWYIHDEDRDRRWAHAEWGCDFRADPISRTLEIAVDPLAGTPLWSVARTEVWARVPYQPPL